VQTSPLTASRPTAAAAPRGGLATSLAIVLGALAAMEIVDIAARLHRARLVDHVLADRQSYTVTAARRADDFVGVAVGIRWLVGLAVIVLFIVWFHAAVKRVDETRGGLHHAPGWAIGAWFVPILCWIRPKQMYDDAWRSSGASGTRERPPWWVHAWWAAWVGSGVLAIVSSVTAANRADGLRPLADADRLAGVADAVELMAAVLAIAAVLGLSARVARLGAPARRDPLPGYGFATAPTAYRFNPPPGWPQPPEGWVPPPGWTPDPSWPPAPAGWQFWLPR
jgi:hypothetical protein